jgi:hypothetical protein
MGAALSGLGSPCARGPRIVRARQDQAPNGMHPCHHPFRVLYAHFHHSGRCWSHRTLLDTAVLSSHSPKNIYMTVHHNSISNCACSHCGSGSEICYSRSRDSFNAALCKIMRKLLNDIDTEYDMDCGLRVGVGGMKSERDYHVIHHVISKLGIVLAFGLLIMNTHCAPFL